MSQNRLSIEKSLQQIANMLVLNGTLINCPGLIHGKMGIAIFFFHYSRHTGNRLFVDYAVDLIEIIQEQIHANSSADYEQGISGIGAGMDYLFKNKFLEADDDTFEDFDERMYRAVMYDPWRNFSLYDGLTGYGKYWISRLPSLQAQKCLLRIVKLIEDRLPDISEKEQSDVYCFLHNLQKTQGFELCAALLEKKSTIISHSFSRLGNSPIGCIVRMLQCNHYFGDTFTGEIDASLKQMPCMDMDKSPVSMGLLTGYAGEGLLRLITLDPKNASWIYLL